MSDYTIFVKDQAKVFPGGPPLVKMATGEEADDESLGGAVMHATKSGLADFVAVDERDAIPAHPRPGPPDRSRGPRKPRGPPSGVDPRYDAAELVGIACADLRVPYDPREVLARVVDASEFDEFKPAYGTALGPAGPHCTATRSACWPTPAACLFSEEAQKAAQFIQLGQLGPDTVAVPAEHDRLHGRRPVRAGRHHQARGADDQRGLQLAGAAPDANIGRLVRRGQLRHVRPGVRARGSCSPGRTRSRP
jgi:hypothetical protein